MKNKTYFAAAVVLLLAISAYWYWSPFLAVRQLQTAAQNGDAETFNDHVDYSKLRESLKGQFSALVAEKMGAPQDASNPFAALSSLIGLGLVNQMVDALVRPEMVMSAMKNGQLRRPAAVAQTGGPAPMPSSTTPSSSSAGPGEKARWVIDRRGANKMTAYAVDPERPDVPNSERLGLVFERSGFVDWKLTDLRIPAAALSK